VDVGQISQVIQNLVLNADQAMPAGGRITIRASNIVIGSGMNLSLDPGGYISVSVIDRGQGISSNHLPRIFDPYFTTKEEGSGLGLATAYAIIKNHDGHITVDSSPQGHVFHLLRAGNLGACRRHSFRHWRGRARAWPGTRPR